MEAFHRIRSFLCRHASLIASAALPAFVLLAVYAAMGVFPFGTKTIMSTDMSMQYVDFFAAFKRVLAGQDGLFWSWSKTLGGDFLGLFAYYLASPFSFLALLFPYEHITEGLMFLS